MRIGGWGGGGGGGRGGVVQGWGRDQGLQEEGRGGGTDVGDGGGSRGGVLGMGARWDQGLPVTVHGVALGGKGGR